MRAKTKIQAGVENLRLRGESACAKKCANVENLR
ncbi:hypothetical protein JOD55_000608 [Arcanobacterium pluranimalium]|nr:hypothetical protein [Arcanobacterium pluranimalium]